MPPKDAKGATRADMARRGRNGRDVAFGAIAAVQAEAGEDKAARESIEKIKTPTLRGLGLPRIILAWVVQGRRLWFAKPARRFSTLCGLCRNNNADTLCELLALAVARDYDGALKAAEETPQPGEREGVYSEIADIRAKAGDLIGARKMVEEYARKRRAAVGKCP